MPCSHRGCKCRGENRIRREGKEFCSESFATAETQNQHQQQCPCGHPDCVR